MNLNTNSFLSHPHEKMWHAFSENMTLSEVRVLLGIWGNQSAFSLSISDDDNKCFIVLLLMLVLLNFSVKILTGIIKNVIWSENCN